MRLAFGVGSMIYSGLEFAQYFEESSNPKCHNVKNKIKTEQNTITHDHQNVRLQVLMAITPAARMLFSFFQMYFIFLNSKVKQIFKVAKYWLIFP